MRSGKVLLTRYEINWLAGLLEAEGCFMAGTPSQPRTPRMYIGMTDYDIIERVAAMLHSSIKHFRIDAEGLKPQYSIQVGGGSFVSLTALLRPLMGQRRQDQIERALSCYAKAIAYPSRAFEVIDPDSEGCERHWLAGYLEGEGHFGLQQFSTRSGPYAYAHFEVCSTDRDVIEHVKSLLHDLYAIDLNIQIRQPPYEGSKLVHRLSATGAKARAIMKDLCPLLGLRRQEMIRAALGADAGERRAAFAP